MATKQLVYTRPEFQQWAQGIYAAFKNLVTSVLDGYNSLELPALTNNDFVRLFNEPVELIFDKITGGELTIGTLKVNRLKAIDIIEKPENYDAFMSQLSAFDQYAKRCFCPANSNGRSALIAGQSYGNIRMGRGFYPFDEIYGAVMYDGMKAIPKFFKLDDDGILTYQDETQTIINESGKCYITSDLKWGYHQFIGQVVELYNTMNFPSLAKDNEKVSSPKVILERFLASIDANTNLPVYNLISLSEKTKDNDASFLENGFAGAF